MKTTNGILLIITALVLAALPGIAGESLKLEKDGHHLQVGFKVSVETNHWVPNPDQAVYYRNHTTNGFLIWPPPERSFPREDESCDIFEVRSNVYAIVVLDGQSNQIATASTPLGFITRSRKVTITTQTNVLTCESWKAP